MRKTLDLAITAEGRDKGKLFVLTEMSAVKAEKWTARAVLALTKSGANLPLDVFDKGAAFSLGVVVSALGGVEFADVEPLLDEMMACVTIAPDPRKRVVTRPLVEDDLEEVATILKVREELVTLHTGFSLADLKSKTAPKSAETGTEPNTKTSRRASEAS